MYGSAAVAAAAALRQVPRLALRSAARPVSGSGGSAYSMAMHVHSSFSEQDGSMAGQLLQAASNAVDVLWWTDHDHRMNGLDYRDTVHFTSLDHEQGGPGQGGSWKWLPQESGPVASGSGGGIVTQPSSPNDPVAGGSMYLTARSNGAQTARYGFYADCQPADWNYRDNLTGQTLDIDVLLETGWRAGFLELLIGTSYHQASGGRPAGDYSLSYRFVPPGTPAGRSAQGLQGVITIPVTPSGSNPWYTATLSPSGDIADLWPDLDYRDFALWELTLNAASDGDQVGGYFDYLRFNRTMGGEASLAQQRDMGARLAADYPSVVQQQGLEVSWRTPHVNWFGPLTFPSYGAVSEQEWVTYLAGLVPQIHQQGGLVSYNHPFGTSQQAALPRSQQDAMLVQLARDLLPGGSQPDVLGCDLLEVGYPLRAGVDLAHHVALWDIMSRNAVFLTGNGTSDDHWGQDWLTGRHAGGNNWVTSAWAAGTSQPDLLAALAAGQAWCGSLASFRGALDLTVDGSCPMGSVSISRVNTRRLDATVTGVPAGGSLQILQGAVDYAGAHDLAPDTQVIGSYPASELTSGSVSVTVDNRKASFVRTQVLDAAGAVVGLSNPAWLLQRQPPGGVPKPRAT
jgi:hypothetical protein